MQTVGFRSLGMGDGMSLSLQHAGEGEIGGRWLLLQPY